MSIASGSRLGPFEVLGTLGAGGMGEVYRARDTALNREVALKVLPSAFAKDPDRLARFAREAQALAALNHPNIAQIYGLEQTESTPALVLELVEGPTLADMIAARGPANPLPIGDALAIARQMADALEAAHNAGIVHRDLKPANIKLRLPATVAHSSLGQLDLSETTVKVLDFGLAKALSADHASGAGDASRSPTLTHRATALGVILGTAAYMAPEQARGRTVDKRADIWAFGVVLLEMLSGRRVFKGEEATDVLAQVLTAEPDWNALPAGTPPAVRRLLRRCLEKDPRKRLRDIGDARIELDDGAADPGSNQLSNTLRGEQHSATSRRAVWLGWFAAAGLAATLGIVAFQWPDRPRPAAPLQFTLEGFGSLPVSSDFAVSPDGTMLAMITGTAQQKPAIWIRPLGGLEARVIAGTEGAVDLFWSADSQSIGFLSGGQIRHVKVATGIITAACQTSIFSGGALSHDNTIVFSAGAGGLRRCDSPKPITTVVNPEISHSWPVFLPDGRHILYLAEAPERTELRVVSLDGTTTKVIGPAESNAVFAAGHLIYIIGNRLVAQPFDLAALQTTGDPLLLDDSPPESVVARRRGVFSASNGGMLVHRLLRRIPAQLTWVDRSGRPVGKVGGPGIYINLNLDPTGRRLAVSMPTGSPPNVDIWLIDFERADQFTQLTDHAGAEYDPAWSPDGRALIFNSNRQGPFALFQKPADPGSNEEAIVSTGWNTTPEWSRPAKAIFYTLVSSASRDIWLLPLEGERKPRVFLATRFDERDPAPSPDGRFIAYESDASGRREIYVRPYPAGEPAVPVSVAGGLAPRWRGDGKEIVFVSLDGMMMGAAAETSAGLRIAPPKALFPVAISTNGHSYAVSNDGQRFLIQVRQPGAQPSPLIVTTNFLASAVR